MPDQPDLAPEEVAASLGRTGRVLETGAGSLWVEETGPVAGPAVVLVHGFGGSTWSWRATAPALAAAGFRVVMLDLVGFGLTPRAWRLSTTHEAQAERVLGVMDALGIDRATLVGHSMGGSVVAWLAARHPSRLDGVVLVDAAAGPAAGGGGSPLGALLELPNIRRIGQLALRLILTDEQLAAALRSAYADPSRLTTATLAGYTAPLRVADWDLGLLAVVRDGGANALDRPIGEVLRMPTLVVWGREDPWIPLASGEALRAALPAAAWAVIDDAGHLPMEEQPAAFNTVLLEWLEATR